MVRKSFGFTILELLIVFSVMSLVTTGGIFVAKTQIQKAHDARRKEDLEQLQQALEHYYSDYGRYAVAAIMTDCGGNGLVPYVAQIPCDPVLKQAYEYEVDAAGQWYRLYTKLGWIKDPVITKIGCLSGCGPGSAYNYGVASAGVQIGSGGEEEGVEPECGGPGKWFCFANVCSECCPGSNYRCNAAGTRCVVDTTCGN